MDRALAIRHALASGARGGDAAAMRPEAKRIGRGMDTRARMIDQLSRRRPGFSLPQPFYTDPDFLRLDHETIFYRTWLFAGHDCEIPARGHYFTMQIGDYPIIVLRSRTTAKSSPSTPAGTVAPGSARPPRAGPRGSSALITNGATASTVA
jgi:hypothetical protein